MYIFGSADINVLVFLFLSTFIVIALANQEKARKGNFLGMAGVSIGISSTVSEMSLVGE